MTVGSLAAIMLVVMVGDMQRQRALATARNRPPDQMQLALTQPAITIGALTESEFVLKH